MERRPFSHRRISAMAFAMLASGGLLHPATANESARLGDNVLASVVILAAAPAAVATAATTPTPTPTAAAPRIEPPPPAPEFEDPASNPRPTPTPIAFFAPLSLRKSVELLQRVETFLPSDVGEGPQGFPPETPVYSLKRMVIGVYNYLEFRDDLHTSLADYQWVLLGRGEASHEDGDGATTMARYSFNPTVDNISALSFEVTGADAFLHRVTVFDENVEVAENFLRQPPVLIQHSLPRREVFHVWRRTSVSRIEIEISRANVGGPRPVVVMRGGITQKPEYIKTAMYWLRSAQSSIDENNVPQARRALIESRRNIESYLATTRRH